MEKINKGKDNIMDLNLKLIYFSATENTQTILRAIAEEIDDGYIEYDITPVKAREEAIELDQNDLLLVGAPVYAGRIPELVVDYFKKLEGNRTPAVFIVTYGNRDYDDALLELKDLFEENDFIAAAAGAFIGEHSNSKKIAGARPDETDLNSAKEFGRQIKSKVDEKGKFVTDSNFKVKGSYPYKERHDSPNFAPKTADQCIECAVCAENCPVNAISFTNFIEIDEAKCIHCCSCIQKCPVEAKYMDHPHFEEITNYLIENFGEKRKEAEIFI
jgi:ferredoxin